MKYLLAKDYNRREAYKRAFPYRRKIMFFLRDTLMIKSPYFEKRIIKGSYKKLYLYRYSSLSRIRNRFYMSGKGRAVFRKHKLSRIRLREALRVPIVYGLRKSYW